MKTLLTIISLTAILIAAFIIDISFANTQPLKGTVVSISHQAETSQVHSIVQTNGNISTAVSVTPERHQVVVKSGREYFTVECEQNEYYDIQVKSQITYYRHSGYFTGINYGYSTNN